MLLCLEYCLQCWSVMKIRAEIGEERSCDKNSYRNRYATKRREAENPWDCSVWTGDKKGDSLPLRSLMGRTERAREENNQSS